MESAFDREKFKAVVHYLCHHARRDFGRLKLHKALYFADMVHFIEHGRPLTGVEYVKQQFGPTARHLKSALDELERSSKVRVTKENYFGLTKYTFESLSQPVSNLLSQRDTDLLGEVLDFVSDHSATALSELSHNEAWRAFEIGAAIPYETAYWLIPVEITVEDVEWAKSQPLSLAS